MRNLLNILVLLTMILWTTVRAFGDTPQDGGSNKAAIVIMSSYNPDVSSTSQNISEFYDECKKHKELANSIVVEDINAQNLPDSREWKKRMRERLKPYFANGQRPACIVLLGNEATSTYFSLDNPELKKIPVVVGMRGTAMVKLPENDSVKLSTWEPPIYDLTRDFKDYNIIGGRLYKYDIGKNLDLVKHFYPNCRNIVFLTDNTLGGVTMKAVFREYMKNNKNFAARYIDGRVQSFLEVNELIADLPRSSVLLTGTWRVDNSNRFIVRNTTYTLCQNNPDLPVFSVADVGMGHWPIGGFSPSYHVMGKYLAQSVVNFLLEGKKDTIAIAPSKYIFDYNRLKTLNLSLDGFDGSYEMKNEPVSVFEEYMMQIVFTCIIITILVISVIVLTALLRKGKIMRIKLQEQGKSLLEAKENAEQANKMKSQFIANISHEIRTPLNAVMGFVQLLTDEQIPKSQEERKQYCDLIMTNSNLLMKLINDILDISRVDAGKMSLQLETVDLVKVIESAVKSASAGKSPKVEIFAKSPLPNKMIETDRNRLMQILSNLLNNAKKCTESGSIMVTFEDLPLERCVRISVTDTGCGIPADKAKVVFERFRKLDNFRQGTGLGLSICKLLVERLGGKIWVDTEYTGGARFVFTHPVKPVLAAE